MSDGSSNLYFLDPESLQVVKKIDVTDNSGAIPNLNELEFINGAVYANQWQTHYIYKIDPSTGNVLGRIDLKGLEDDLLSKFPNLTDEGYVLNGIAYDSINNKIYITGKKWPSLYEIKLQ
jgi:glutaminyl-peptide cyclotransferase